MGVLSVENLSYHIAQKEIIKNFSLNVKKGEIVTLFGPSGCGKSTFLRVISGLLKPNDGKIKICKKIAYMFQEHRLFESLNAYENIAIVMQKPDPNQIYSMLEELGISKQEASRYPKELSGGMIARVAFIRAIVVGADLMLLDEPFSGLDFAMREILINKLKSIAKNSGISVILVTHDAYEACKISNRIIFLSRYGMNIEKSLQITQENLDENMIKSLFDSEFKGRIYFD